MRRKRSILVGAVTSAVLALAVFVATRPAAPAAQAVPLPPPAVAIPDRNRVNLGARNLPNTFDLAKGTNVRWSAELGSHAYGGPVVSGGRVFVGTNNENPRDPKIKGDKGVLMCFDEATGKFLWQIVHDKLASGRVTDWPYRGVMSSPAVEGDYLYYVSNRAEVVCAAVAGDPKNPGHGKVVWLLDMIDKLGVFPHNQVPCSPLIVGDTIFVVTGNGVDESYRHIPGLEAPSFLALDRATGKVRWQSNLPTAVVAELKKAGKPVDYLTLMNEGRLLHAGQWSSPVYLAPNARPMVVFPGGDGWLYAFTLDKGELLWKFDCNPRDARLSREGTRNNFVAAPVVWDNKIYIAVGQDPEFKQGVGHLWCIDPGKQPQNQDKDVSPDQKVSALVWHHGGAAANPFRPWSFGRSVSTCAVHDGLCYAADLGGMVYCIDARTGVK